MSAHDFAGWAGCTDIDLSDEATHEIARAAWEAGRASAFIAMRDQSGEIARLTAEIAKLQEEAEAYRWLRARMFVQRNGAVPDRYGLSEYLLAEDINEEDDVSYINAAIRAAINAER